MESKDEGSLGKQLTGYLTQESQESMWSKAYEEKDV